MDRIHEVTASLKQHRLTKKMVLWLTLACFSRKFVENRLIGLPGLVGSLKTVEMGVILHKSGHGSNIM
jgi:hypothetical protein